VIASPKYRFGVICWIAALCGVAQFNCLAFSRWLLSTSDVLNLGICCLPFSAVEIVSSRVRSGSVAAAGESILSVRSGELIDDGRCKI
jgi:hypothetical protein